MSPVDLRASLTPPGADGHFLPAAPLPQPCLLCCVSLAVLPVPFVGRCFAALRDPDILSVAVSCVVCSDDMEAVQKNLAGIKAKAATKPAVATASPTARSEPTTAAAAAARPGSSAAGGAAAAEVRAKKRADAVPAAVPAAKPVAQPVPTPVPVAKPVVKEASSSKAADDDDDDGGYGDDFDVRGGESVFV